jgi:hypothetical protein
MKRLLLVFAVLALSAWSVAALAAPAPAAARAASTAGAVVTPVDDDPDMPAALANGLDKAAYMEARERAFMMRYGDSFEGAYEGRLEAIAQLQNQVRQQAPFIALNYWTPVGPYPIPNGQTTSFATPVSGRVTAIAVHPTNPDIVYVGLAQGGVLRSLNGGATWTPIFESASSLAIGALTLAPSNPTILYVGTGEPNLSGDSFFGVACIASTTPTRRRC